MSVSMSTQQETDLFVVLLLTPPLFPRSIDRLLDRLDTKKSGMDLGVGEYPQEVVEFHMQLGGQHGKVGYL